MANLWFYNSMLKGYTPTLTSGTADAFFPLANLSHNHTTKEFRTTSLTTAYIDYNLIDDVQPDSFLVCGNKVTGELHVATIQIKGSTVSNFSSGYDSGIITLGQDDLSETFKYISLAPTRAYQYWRIILTNDTGYIGCSNMFLGAELGLTTNAITYGWDFTRIDRSTVQEGRYGNRFVDRISDQKQINVSFELLNKNEFELIEEMTTFCGVSEPLWLVIDPNEVIINNANIFSGYFFLTQRPVFSNPAFSLMNTSLSLIEVI